MMPLYTRVLSSADYGTVDILVQTANLLLPLATCGMSNAIIRFGLDRATRKEDVYNVALRTILCGLIVLAAVIPLLGYVDFIGENTLLIYLYVLMSSFRSLNSNFVRSQEKVRLFAIDGVLSTATVVAFNVLFLVGFRWGVKGYVLSTICSDLLSTVFLFLVAKLWRYIHLGRIRYHLTRSMLRYAIPLIPTTIFWWITNVSDRYMVTAMISTSANGLYAAAYKIPTVVTLISGIFIDAWQMSAVTENDLATRESFYSRVFGAYQSIVFLSAAGLTVFAKVLTTLLVSPAYYESWRYIPFLLMATTFSCFVSFLGSVYMVEKKSGMTLLTTVIGAGVNVALNLTLIPRIGVNGAAIATFLSYLAVFIIRAVDTRRFIRIDWNLPKFAFNFAALIAMAVVMIAEPAWWMPVEIALVVAMAFVNAPPIWDSFCKLFLKKGRHRNIM